MSRTLIIGYGNSLRGDDAIGIRAAEQLRQRGPGPDLEILSVHQLTPELVDPISRAGRVIFIDAAAGPNPGQIAERRIHAAPFARPFTHVATPEALLAGASALYGSEPHAILITVTASTFDLGEDLSAPVQKALESVIQRCWDCAQV